MDDIVRQPHPFGPCGIAKMYKRLSDRLHKVEYRSICDVAIDRDTLESFDRAGFTGPESGK